jgi:hypothetical protein
MSQDVAEGLLFEELSERAKEVVRDKFRRYNLDHEWWDSLYEDFINVAACLGFSVKPANIFWTGFSCQGDGASFAGMYAGDCNHADQVRAHAPEDEELARIATTLDVLRVEAALMANSHWRAEIQCRAHHYFHSGAMLTANVYLDDDHTNDTGYEHADEIILQAARDLADWLYKALEEEYDYLQSDESIDPLIADYRDRYTEDGATI